MAENEPPPPVKLSPEEIQAFRDLPVDVALERVKTGHRTERCPECGKFVGNHTLKMMKRCLVAYWNEEEGRD